MIRNERIIIRSGSASLPDDICEITVVSNDTNMGVILNGGGAVSKGVLMTVSAEKVKSEYEFEGWYSDGDIVSNELTYTFEVTHSTVITAAFKEADVALPSGYVKLAYLDCPALASGKRYIENFPLRLSVDSLYTEVGIKFSLYPDYSYTKPGYLFYYSYSNNATTSASQRAQRNMIQIPSSGGVSATWSGASGSSADTFSSVSLAYPDISNGHKYLYHLYKKTNLAADLTDIDTNTLVATKEAATNKAFLQTAPQILLLGSSANAYPFIGQLYEIKIYNSNALLNYLVPAKNADGVCGLYDVVTNEFYSSATENLFGEPE